MLRCDAVACGLPALPNLESSAAFALQQPYSPYHLDIVSLRSLYLALATSEA